MLAAWGAGKKNSSVIITGPPLVILGEHSSGPIEVILLQDLVLDTLVLLTHPVSRGARGPPEGLPVSPAFLFRPRMFTIRRANVDIVGGLVRREQNLLRDRLRLLRRLHLGEVPSC